MTIDRARPRQWVRGHRLTGAALLGLALFTAGMTPSPVAASNPETAAEALAAVPLPPSDLGQSTYQFFIPETGHTISGLFVDYWRATGGAAVYGNPISEPFAATNGLYSQAFERGILQFHLEQTWTEDPFFRLMPIGPVALDEDIGAFRADGKRAGGGGDRRAAAWVSSDLAGPAVGDEFQEWYVRHEGAFYLGNPISQPIRERGELVQWFEGGLLMFVDGEVGLAPLPTEMAATLGIDTTPLAANGVPVYDEALFWNGAAPPAAGIPADGAKRIEISLSEQQIWVYQGDELVLTSLVSTGLEPNETSTGNFRVRIKKPLEDMRGAVNEKGEVIWVAGEKGGPPRGSIPYGVEDVPNVLYFSLDAEALHGAYWHDNFGNRMSHGCVNLPLEVAEFLYTWAPLGTPVLVTE
ncbi:MAG: L,D-transpeptidase [Chloroflexota bacterium]|nr:L,D-transpeptidase [Chloroflexota bacterium]